MRKPFEAQLLRKCGGFFAYSGAKVTLTRDAKEYKPMRNAVMHTARLTDDAKLKLTSVYNNIKGRIQNILKQDDSEESTDAS